MEKVSKSINLALQGGGSHGAFTWGVLDALLEDERIKFEAISATSAGAVNAAILAYGWMLGGRNAAKDALHQFWKELSELGLCEYLLYFCTNIYSPYEFNPYNFNLLKNLLNKFINFEELQKSNPIKLFISATNVKTGKIKIFTNENMTVDVILAAACFPLYFQAVKIEEDYYWDGGYMGNPALFPLIYGSSCHDILIIQINPIYIEDVPKSKFDILSRMNEVSFNSSLMREMRVISFVNKLLEDGWIKSRYRKKLQRFYFHAIHAENIINSCSPLSKLNTEWGFLTKMHDSGYIKGRLWLDEHFSQIGKCNTLNFDDYL